MPDAGSIDRMGLGVTGGGGVEDGGEVLLRSQGQRGEVQLQQRLPHDALQNRKEHSRRSELDAVYIRCACPHVPQYPIPHSHTTPRMRV